MKKTLKRKSQISPENKEIDYHYSLSNSSTWATTFRRIKTQLKVDTTLLALAGAPIIDGLYVSWLANGLMANPMEAIIFGMTALSGGGCIGAVINNQESTLKKSISISLVYFLIFVSSMCIGVFSPIFINAAPKNLAILTATFLITLGIKISGFKKLDKLWGINPGSAIRIIIVVFFLNSVQARPIFAICTDGGLFLNISISVLSGFVFTSIGLFFSAITARFCNFDYSFIKKGQACSLILIGLKIIFPVFPTWLALLPLILGFIMGFIKIVIDSKYCFSMGDNNNDVL